MIFSLSLLEFWLKCLSLNIFLCFIYNLIYIQFGLSRKAKLFHRKIQETCSNGTVTTLIKHLERNEVGYASIPQDAHQVIDT